MRLDEDGSIAMVEGDDDALKVVATGSLKYLGDCDDSTPQCLVIIMN